VEGRGSTGKGSVEAAQPFDLVGHGVGVHDIHDHRDPGAVSGIHERLQVLGVPKRELAAKKFDTW